MYCLLTVQPTLSCFMTCRTTTIFGISAQVKLVRLYCHNILLGGRGIGGGVREDNGYCFLLRMVTSLFLFIMVAFENLLYIPDSKMVLTFFLLRKCSKRAQCSNEFMFNSRSRFYVTQWSATRLCGGLNVGSHPSPRNNSPWQPSYNCLTSILVLIKCCC